MPSLRTAFLVAVALVGMVMTFHPTLFSGFARMQPDPGDMVLNHYFLEHTYRWEFDSTYPYSFWSPGFYYPVPNTFTYSETLIGVAPLYWLFRTVFAEELSSQLWMLTLCLLNYAAMAIVLRRFGASIPILAAGRGICVCLRPELPALGSPHAPAACCRNSFSPDRGLVCGRVLVREPTARRHAGSRSSPSASPSSSRACILALVPWFRVDDLRPVADVCRAW